MVQAFMPTVNKAVVWVSTTCSVVVTYRRFGRTCSHRGKRIRYKFYSSMLNFDLFFPIPDSGSRIYIRNFRIHSKVLRSVTIRNTYCNSAQLNLPLCVYIRRCCSLVSYKILIAVYTSNRVKEYYDLECVRFSGMVMSREWTQHDYQKL